MKDLGAATSTITPRTGRKYLQIVSLIRGL